MNALEDYIVANPYQPTKEEKAAINKLEKSGLVAGDWDSTNDAISAFKDNLRTHMYHQQNRRCVYCRMRVSMATEFLHREHIVPKSPHPQWMFLPKNLCVACQKCNTYKSDKETLMDPNTVNYPNHSDGFKIIHPFFDKYSDHIELIGGIIYAGKTDKGTFTITTCNLSRVELAEERAEKRMEEENPDSVMCQLLSLLDNEDKKAIVQDKIEHIIRMYRQTYNNSK